MRLAIPGTACLLGLALVAPLDAQRQFPPHVLPGEIEWLDGMMDEIDAGDKWTARHFAMIETESAFKVYAESPFAQGLAQFTPPTRGDWWPRIPECAGLLDQPFDPRCAILAMHAYMQWLVRRSLAMTQDEESALVMARRAYNGGLGWQMREHKLCLATPGCDPDSWRHLLALCQEAGRSEAACRENSHYPVKIARAEKRYRKRKGWKRKILKGVAAGVAISQGRVPEIGR